ncbi:hypothetical protein KAT36_00790 [Candidatus Pacearchaeota archaeon]|nr:hypothetical protein [Candidatus Pacearchaeota archaeon]
MNKEPFVVIITAIVLALAVSFKNTDILYAATLSFLIIITANILAKKIVAYKFETDIKTKFWTLYQYGFRKDMHFNKPIPMIWLPLLLTLFSKGFFLWLGVLEFDVKAKPERATRRHGLYRFSEVTEWHMAWIAIWGIITNLILAITAYIAGFELFAKLSIYFIAWSVIPFSRLDGSKIFYASRALWTVVFTIAMLFLALALTVI